MRGNLFELLDILKTHFEKIDFAAKGSDQRAGRCVPSGTAYRYAPDRRTGTADGGRTAGG